MTESATIERYERALAVVAYLVERDGPKVVPLFERLERELAAMRRTHDAMRRARRLLENLGPLMQLETRSAIEARKR